MNAVRRQLWVWLGLLAVFLLVVYLLGSVLVPFVAGMAVAYFLDPVADRLESWGLSRTVATAVITLAFFVVVGLGAFFLLPLIQEQLVAFVARMPAYVEALRAELMPVAEGLLATLRPEDVERVQEAVGGFSETAVGWLAGLIEGLWRSGLAVVQLLALLVITPVVAFYLLRDWDRFVERVNGWLPRQHADVIREQLRLIDQRLAGFARGQVLVCLILAAYYGGGLSLVGLEFGLVVGLAAGLLSFIPYVGSLTGITVSLVLAFLQFDEAVTIVLVVAVFAGGQVLEGYVLTPRLVGKRVGLHPVWVLFAILAGASLFGFVGVLLAVPTAAVIGVVVRFALSRYLASPLYLGTSGDDGLEGGDR
ncbi:MAG: AI-2E family transporter [Alphaproteobacteria bacterium]